MKFSKRVVAVVLAVVIALAVVPASTVHGQQNPSFAVAQLEGLLTTEINRVFEGMQRPNLIRHQVYDDVARRVLADILMGFDEITPLIYGLTMAWIATHGVTDAHLLESNVVILTHEARTAIAQFERDQVFDSRFLGVAGVFIPASELGHEPQQQQYIQFGTHMRTRSLRSPIMPQVMPVGFGALGADPFGELPPESHLGVGQPHTIPATQTQDHHNIVTQEPYFDFTPPTHPPAPDPVGAGVYYFVMVFAYGHEVPAPTPTPEPEEEEEEEEEEPEEEPEEEVTEELPSTVITGPMNLGPTALNQVVDTGSAVAVTREVLNRLTPAQREQGHIELFAENALTRAVSTEIDVGRVTLNQASLAPKQAAADEALRAMEGMFAEEGYELRRPLSSGVSFIASEESRVNIIVGTSAADVDLDIVRISTPYYEITFPAGFIQTHVSDSPLTVTVNTANSIEINFSREPYEPIRLSTRPMAGSPEYQTMKGSDGIPVPSRLNPATGLLDARVRVSDTFTVVENRVDFTDILHLSQEMQSAIRTMAAQGIIQGTGAGNFSPGDSVNRAQIAALITRMLGSFDPNADGGFNDVNPTDWFFGAAGSANKIGIMQGTGEGQFSPVLVLPRDQLTVVSARVLVSEMGYRVPTNSARYLQSFNDRSALHSWSEGEIALANRENLIILRADGTFRPAESMTRADVALMLNRLYSRLW